ncbi:MAG: DNA alkylation repair protein [Anaerohalosphaera sp.]|nr:DNA alkylation repair protein [Anaerohalosphaera sp.]
MKALQLHEDIRAYCQKHADKKQVEKYAKFFTEGFDAYGLTKEIFEDKVRSLINDKKVTMRLVLYTSKLLVKSGKYEETNFAICLLKEFSDQFNEKTLAAIEKWFQIGIVNWAHCDILCGHLMTPLFENEIISLEELSDWRISKNKYQRRAVPVSMLTLLKTNKSFKPLFAFIEPIMMDPEKKVQQGLGWFLREAWKIKQKQTEDFLLKWKDRSPRTIFQYATEKMAVEERKRFRRCK